MRAPRLDDCLDEAWCAPVARHLGHFDTGAEAELRQGRRYAVSARLARLFAAYAVQRPTLLADWLDGRATDGRGGDLDDDLAWQPELWRRLVDRVGAPPPHQRHADTLARLRDEPEAFDLPDAALAVRPHPAAGHRGRAARRAGRAPRRTPLAAAPQRRALGRARPGGRRRRRRPRRRRQPPRRRPPAAGHPRPRQPRAAAGPGRGRRPTTTTPRCPPAPDTLLGWLQDDLRGNTLAPAGRTCAAGDRSVQVHACHGAARQVDVLREVLLGMLRPTRPSSRATSW